MLSDTPARRSLSSVLGVDRALIGMIHVGATPGSPRASMAPADLARDAADEARVLADAGFAAAIIENMHDRPYVLALGAETVACMTRAGLAVREAGPGLALGVQILGGVGFEALAVAHAIDAAFIRAENFTFAHVADEGLMPVAGAGPLLRYRRAIGAERIAVFADVKKKHASHAITSDIALADACRAAEFFLADGVIVTGASTASPTDPADLVEARASTGLPILVGSGASADDLPALLAHSDGVIVGSAIKRDGLWSNPLDPARCRAFAAAFRAAV